MSRIGVFGLGLGLLLALPVQAKTLYLVRHAEKAPGPDPALTQCGQRRAQALAERFADKALAAVFSSDTRRTRETAGPTAAAQGLYTELYDPRDLPALEGSLRRLDGDALVVGHSNTTPELAGLFIGQPQAEMAHHEFDRLYLVDLDAGTLSVTEQGFSCPP